MKIVIAIDSLKGSLSSIEAGKAAREGILKAIPDAEVVLKPLADGGEGTTDALISGMGGTRKELTVTGPMGNPVKAYYGVVNKQAEDSVVSRKTAVIEMAMAAGITLVAPEDRNPLNAGTYGVGEVILSALEQGCRDFIIGIGGSATNDGGLGMLVALGYRFLKKDGSQAEPKAKELAHITAVEDNAVNSLLKECRFRIACDVENPLCGANGASYVFGTQKGADSAMMKYLDSSLQQFAAVTENYTKKAVSTCPGTGAAGGLGYAFLAYLNGVLEPGIEIVLDTIGLEKELEDTEIVVTGEGRLDIQTAMGKAPVGVAKLAKKHGCKVLALAGCTTPEAAECNRQGIDAYFPILQRPCSVKEAMDTDTARKNMVFTAEQVFRLVRAVR